MKNFILFILLIAVCSNATEDWNFDYETGGSNFTKKQRWQTGALNILPGVGSYFIMDDFTGAAIQWGLSGAGVAMIVLYFATKQEDEHCNDYWDGIRCEYDFDYNDNFAFAAFAFFGSSFIYNIYRSITYNKPKKTAYSENSGFNIAVLPNRNGKLNAFLIYNKAF